MRPSLPGMRYERKFTTREPDLGNVLALLQRHPASFREAYPPRMVNNIYLDSPGLGAYHDHVNGVSHRLKTRVRWYGEANGQILSPTVERKLKCGSVSGKIAQGLPPIALSEGRLAPSLAATFARAPIPEAWRAALRFLQPTLFNRYRRCYFVSADGRFRVTLDAELCFGDPRAATTGKTVAARLLVLELKFAPENAEQATWITNAFPYRLVRCSKYVLGVERHWG